MASQPLSVASETSTSESEMPGDLRVFVFAYDRFDTMSTSLMLSEGGVPHTVLCHRPGDAERFRQAGTVGSTGNIVPTGEAKGLARQRNIALEWMDEGEWALFLVDDLKDVTELDSYDEEPEEVLDITFANQGAYRQRFDTPTGMDRFVERALASAAYGDFLGTKLVGFAGFNNAVYRRKKWQRNVLADGRAWMVKKTHLRFDQNVQLIDDLCWTAQNIKEFGTVLVNNWILPDCRRYTAGGFGSIDERMKQKKQEAAYLVTAYPELITFKKKAGWPERSHVVLRPTARTRYTQKG